MSAGSEPLGAVLVGGESRRMGTDKALLRWGGEALAARAARTLARQLDEVVVVSKRSGDHSDLGIPEIADRLPGLGPLSGIHAALEHAGGRAVFVLACDLPRVGSDLVGYLLERAASGPAGPWVVLPTLDGRAQPLAAVYSADCLSEVEHWLVSGRRRTLDFVDSVDSLQVELTPELGFFRADLLENVNDAEGVKRLESSAREDRPGVGGG